MMGNILVIGATSSIARALSMALAKEKHHVILAGRDKTELEKIATDIEIRTQSPATSCELDIEKIETHTEFMENLLNKINTLDGVIVAAGTMEPPFQKTLMTNFNGAVSILEWCAQYFENTANQTNLSQPRFIAVLSSVAGDRGRKSNYVYGAAKGGLNIYCQGLQNRLFKKNIRVITIKLGFVDTAMTFGLKGLFLVATPEKIAEKVIRKFHQQLNITDTVYLPWFWRIIMIIIKTIPECLFKRMSL